MKMTKKIMSLAIVFAMVMALAVTSMAASITINPPAVVDGAVETGITYTAYKIFDATIAGTNVSYTIDSMIDGVVNPIYTEVAKATDYFTLTQINGTTKYNVTVNEDNYTSAAANTFADTLKAVATNGTVLTEQTDGKYKVDGLGKGYYLITSSVGSDLILETLGDVTADAKNDYPTLDKWIVETTDVKTTTADMGEVLNFRIDVTIPEDAVGEIVVHDDMTGLQYVAMTAVDGITVAQNDNDGCDVHFTLSETYVAANKGTTIAINYTAKLTAEIAGNTAWLTDGTYKGVPAKTTVYSTDIIINKVIKDTTTPLADAKFVLKNEAGKFYAVDAQGVVTWVDTQAAATEVTTVADGTAEFANMADGTYYLVETVAPDGYNLLTAPVTVNVAAALNNDGTEVIDIPVEVENSTGTELPSTGGIGTTIFYALGGLMAVGAGVLLVAKKRMEA